MFSENILVPTLTDIVCMYIVYIIFPCSHSPYLVAFLIHSSYLQGVLEISTDPQISSLPFTYLAISSPRFCTRYLA